MKIETQEGVKVIRCLDDLGGISRGERIKIEAKGLSLIDGIFFELRREENVDWKHLTIIIRKGYRDIRVERYLLDREGKFIPGRTVGIIISPPNENYLVYSKMLRKVRL